MRLTGDVAVALVLGLALLAGAYLLSSVSRRIQPRWVRTWERGMRRLSRAQRRMVVRAVRRGVRVGDARLAAFAVAEAMYELRWFGRRRARVLLGLWLVSVPVVLTAGAYLAIRGALAPILLAVLNAVLAVGCLVAAGERAQRNRRRAARANLALIGTAPTSTPAAPAGTAPGASPRPPSPTPPPAAPGSPAPDSAAPACAPWVEPAREPALAGPAVGEPAPSAAPAGGVNGRSPAPRRAARTARRRRARPGSGSPRAAPPPG